MTALPPGSPIPDVAERRPPDLGDDRVWARLSGHAPIAFAPHITRHVDADEFGFVDIGSRATSPIRHRFELSIGGPGSLDVGVGRAVRAADTASEAETSHDSEGEYFALAAEVMAELRREHAPEVPARISFDPGPGVGLSSSTPGVLVAHLVIDEFRRQDTHAPHDGEAWFWCLDANEVPQYTKMEALVRDIVDLWDLRGITPMRHGSLWWVRSLHVHPRCRGDQLGGRLLGYALGELRKGPADLAVLEAHPEPTLFDPPGTSQPGWANWKSYGHPPVSAVDGLARYFGRMGFMRVDDPTSGLGRVQHIDDEDDDEISRRMGVWEDGPDAPGAAVAMYAFLGDLAFRNGPRLGRRVQRRRSRAAE